MVARLTVREQIADLPQEKIRQMSQMAQDGSSIGEIAAKYKLDYTVVQTTLWEQGTLPWQGAKTIITRRMRSIVNAGRRESRARLAKDVQEQVDYLYYAAKALKAQLEKVKRTVR